VEILKSAGRAYSANLLHNQSLKSIPGSLKNVNFLVTSYYVDIITSLRVTFLLIIVFVE